MAPYSALDHLKTHKPSHIQPIAFKINGQIKDLSSPLEEGAPIEWIDRASPEGIEILRHSAAHVLAQAVKELYPDTQVTIGPVIENGFYYDFKRNEPFRMEDLKVITQRMKEIIKRDLTVIRHEWSRAQAIAFFQEQGEFFKTKIIEAIPEDQDISVYQQGDFYDLCRGPHIPHTKALGMAFALTKVSASYWKGDSKGESLQRIYGTAWPCEQDLQEYLTRLEEAEKRDHRRLGQQMDLFHMQEEAPGSIFWHPKGWTIYQGLQQYIRQRLRQEKYVEVNTPQLVSTTLWEKSGHWQKFRENMFCVETPETTFALKPMNCPCHVQIYNHTLKSYRELPLRMAEFGSCMRHEASGARLGIMRVSSFVQDDAHIFCTQDQMIQETTAFCTLLFSVYQDLGFKEVIVRFSTRPETRLGSDEVWDQAEASLRQGAEAAGLSYEIFPGEGAFYGPKLEFVLKDSLGRLWQCGTLQVDFVLPERLQAFYIGPDGAKHHPVMLHRAILGSLERFIGVLLEHTGGHLPPWLTPTQVAIVPVSEKSLEYAQTIEKALDPDLRVHLDHRNEKLGYKVREHTLQKVPYIIVVGEKEAENKTLVLRHGNEQTSYPEKEGVDFLKKACLPPHLYKKVEAQQSH